MGGDDNQGGTVDPAGGGAVPREHGAGEDAGAAAGLVPGALPAPGAPTRPPAAAGTGLPRLMARLGRLLERHGPEGVVVMSEEEYERVQHATYAAGWQDAAQEYGPRIAAARWEGWLGRWRPMRVMDAPGEVIAFPAGQRGGEPGDPAGEAGPAPEAGRDSGAGGVSGGASGGVQGGVSGGTSGGVPGAVSGGTSGGVQGGVPGGVSGAASGGVQGGVSGGTSGGVPGGGSGSARGRPRGGTPVPRPFLSPKNRRSKSPTIPRLPAKEPHRPRRAADAADGPAQARGQQQPGPSPASAPDEPGE
ncbi:hypothetical protein VSR01_24045 [Actinacidiphila sp. DG2A-62]|uniref:hypothetical protein n=1 Tax=Actinacidiphila sp. DG2A-62 TaxID=3108821 RepID=UPI002DBA35BC|nr:hypothetical protein [Actinacidiphila sp. DG2A-62]MEC3996415.1 hypothetical protein [Actinacidiphila sp. DG2A-62]